MTAGDVTNDDVIQGDVMKGVAIEAQAIDARHGDRQVLHGVSLSVQAGQWLAIVGPNGAGKSTLLRCLSGLMTATGGHVMLQGRAWHAWPARARARQLAWLGQSTSGDESMSVRDTIALGRLPHQGWLGSPAATREDQAAVELAMQDTDMCWAAGRALGTLSGGERQRVHLARALAVQAPVMLLDEPVSHLDAPHQRLFANVMAREAGKGRCMISVLHELPLALLADRLAVMCEGRLVAQGRRDDPQVHRAIESVFDHAVTIMRLDERWVAVPAL